MKQAMIIILAAIYSVIILLVFYVFMNRATQVQTEITKVAQEAINEEIDVLKFGNESATDIKDVQETLIRMQDALLNVFK